ncbi:MAG: lysylphosphatidylglycerol synthase transmembrane domain-containing protein [Chloroflexi bacterium]|nr:lysylphosphatidylglycerol synthase transmembrane domain-containing protein [Chloroflexota bacterium]
MAKNSDKQHRAIGKVMLLRLQSRWRPGRLRAFQAIAGIVISIVLLWLVLRGLDLRQTWAALSNTNYWYLAPAVFVYFLGVAIRGLRWQRLLLPVERIPARQAIALLIVGYTVNNIVPARMGDVMRVFLLARETGIRKSASLATVVLERLLDLLAILAIIVACTLVLPWPSPILTALRVAAVLAIVAAGVLILVATHQSQRLQDGVGPARTVWRALALSALLAVLLGTAFAELGQWIPETLLLPLAGAGIVFLLATFVAATVARGYLISLPLRLSLLLPGRLGYRIISMARSFVEGLQSLRSPQRLAEMAGLSMASWIVEGLSYYVIARSMGIDESVLVFLLTMGVINIFSAIPSSPGYIGPFEFAGKLVLTQFGIAAEMAVAYLLLMHVLLLLPVVVLGGALAWRRRERWWPTSVDSPQSPLGQTTT